MTQFKRAYKCSVTFTLIEGEHFNPHFDPKSDEALEDDAKEAFEDMLNTLSNDGDLSGYIVAKKVKDA